MTTLFSGHVVASLQRLQRCSDQPVMATKTAWIHRKSHTAHIYKALLVWHTVYRCTGVAPFLIEFLLCIISAEVSRTGLNSINNTPGLNSLHWHHSQPKSMLTKGNPSLLLYITVLHSTYLGCMLHSGEMGQNVIRVWSCQHSMAVVWAVSFITFCWSVSFYHTPFNNIHLFDNSHHFLQFFFSHALKCQILIRVRNITIYHETMSFKRHFWSLYFTTNATKWNKFMNPVNINKYNYPIVLH